MSDAGPRLAPFKPEPSPPHTNGSRLARERVFSGPALVFGVLVGSLLAVSLIGTIQWLNLTTVGSWHRPVLAAGLAGSMAGWYRRGRARHGALCGLVAAVVSLWAVYGMVRLSTNVIFIERSLARVVTFDLLRLAAYAIPSGALGGATPSLIRAAFTRMRHSRSAAAR